MVQPAGGGDVLLDHAYLDRVLLGAAPTLQLVHNHSQWRTRLRADRLGARVHRARLLPDAMDAEMRHDPDWLALAVHDVGAEVPRLAPLVALLCQAAVRERGEVDVVERGDDEVGAGGRQQFGVVGSR